MMLVQPLFLQENGVNILRPRARSRVGKDFKIGAAGIMKWQGALRLAFMKL
jgi:hypothetical protein